MDLDTLISALQLLRNTHGNLDVFTEEGWPLRNPKMRSNEGTPPEWELPAESVVIRIDN